MKSIIKLLAFVIFISSVGCYHNPRTAWTPPAYKKKPYRPGVK